uniref:Uncharacterized protein n=1 Tax=Arion vulgaris TaxID=1028688 RepID=A0A0B7AZK5_9EUPU
MMSKFSSKDFTTAQRKKFNEKFDKCHTEDSCTSPLENVFCLINIDNLLYV